jgi:hypothetical protein
MSMNFYAESVALLWTTAMRFGVPDAHRPGRMRPLPNSDQDKRSIRQIAISRPSSTTQSAGKRK